MNEFFIEGNVPSSKNGRVWTGRHFIASKATQKWRKETTEDWLSYKSYFLELVKDKPKPLKIGFRFIRGTKHKFDYVNPLQTVLDEMVKQGWIEDDNADIIKPVFLTYRYSKNNPGVIIIVY